MKRAIFNFAVIFSLFAIDALSKVAALRWVAPFLGGEYPFGGIGIFDHFFGTKFSLNLVYNTGAAWGIFANHSALLLTIRLIVVLGITAFLFSLPPKHSARIPMLMIIAGAIGNIVDMFVYGHVVDFLHFQFTKWSFPIFNLADCYISLGVIALLLGWSFHRKRDDYAH